MSLRHPANWDLVRLQLQLTDASSLIRLGPVLQVFVILRDFSNRILMASEKLEIGKSLTISNFNIFLQKKNGEKSFRKCPSPCDVLGPSLLGTFISGALLGILSPIKGGIENKYLPDSYSSNRNSDITGAFLSGDIEEHGKFSLGNGLTMIVTGIADDTYRLQVDTYRYLSEPGALEVECIMAQGGSPLGNGFYVLKDIEKVKHQPGGKAWNLEDHEHKIASQMKRIADTEKYELTISDAWLSALRRIRTPNFSKAVISYREPKVALHPSPPPLRNCLASDWVFTVQEILRLSHSVNITWEQSGGWSVSVNGVRPSPLLAVDPRQKLYERTRELLDELVDKRSIPMAATRDLLLLGEAVSSRHTLKVLPGDGLWLRAVLQLINKIGCGLQLPWARSGPGLQLIHDEKIINLMKDDTVTNVTILRILRQYSSAIACSLGAPVVSAIDPALTVVTSLVLCPLTPRRELNETVN